MPPATLPRDAPSDVERATLQALADGRTYAQIARDQRIRSNSVVMRIRRMATRLQLDVVTTTGIVAQAIRRGWVT